MNTKTTVLLVLGIIVGFIAGFSLANSLNRSELETLRTANSRIKNPQTDSPQNDGEQTLSAEEIKQKIAEADANPSNLQFQKSLGMALYRYASMKQDVKLLSEVSRLLTRAYEKNPSDREVEVTLGNLYFDSGLFEKDNEKLKKARQLYQKILEKTPEDVDVRTDFGLTYFVQNPPEYDKAVVEFQKSLQTNPKHEKTLRFLVQTLIKQEKMREAETYLARLKEVNPNAPSLSEIQTEMAQNPDNTAQ